MLSKNPCAQKEIGPLYWLYCVPPCMVLTQTTHVPSTWKCEIASRPTFSYTRNATAKTCNDEKIMLCSYSTSVLSQNNYSHCWVTQKSTSSLKK